MNSLKASRGTPWKIARNGVLMIAITTMISTTPLTIALNLCSEKCVSLSRMASDYAVPLAFDLVLPHPHFCYDNLLGIFISIG